jgi:tripartite-type tricarboxylate transporter receptor subunit TctC
MAMICARLPRQFYSFLGIVGLWALLAASPAPAQTAADIDSPFHGQNITLIISFASGGPVDGVARVLGGTLSDNLPGRPKVIYMNIPGADGVAALNRLYTITKPDGLTFLIGAGNQLNPVNLRREQVKYDPTKLSSPTMRPPPSSWPRSTARAPASRWASGSPAP